jgi:superfamily II DNA/RNA helicase
MENELMTSVLQKLNISELNEMQNASIAAHETEHDIVIVSPTGSGKTLAYLMPMLPRLRSENKIQSLIIVPSRELALQIQDVFKKMQTGFKVTVVYGGNDSRIERNTLTEPPAVLIGTPGRLADHIRKESIDLSHVENLVLDEFDKSLEFGFEPDMRFIVDQLTNVKKRVLTSATEIDKIPAFTGIRQPHFLRFGDTRESALTLKAVKAQGTDKLEALFRLVCKIGHEPSLIFCNHRETVEQLSQFFQNHKIIHDIYHGKLEQDERELAITKFRNGSNNILLTTDLASRGLDIDNLKHVVHYQLPGTKSSFIHRNGRTARMTAEGSAWLIVSEEDELPDFIKEINVTTTKIEKGMLPVNPEWVTIYLSAGKKDKISKGDIAGFFHQKGNLKKEELGMITITDFASFAAVKKNKASKLVSTLKEERIKNQKLKISLVK